MSSCWCPQLERHWCFRLKLNFVQSHETGSGSVMETVCRTSWSCPWSLELNKGNFAWMKWWILPAGRILNLIKSLRINFAFALFQLIPFNRLCTGSFPLLGHIDCLQPVDVRSSKFTCLAPPLPRPIVRRILPLPDNSKTFSVFWHWTRTLPFKTFLPLGLSTSLYFCPFNIFLVSKHFASGCLPPSPPPDLLLALSLIPSCQCGSRRTRAPLAALCVAHTQRHKDTRHTHTLNPLFSLSIFPLLRSWSHISHSVLKSFDFSSFFLPLRPFICPTHNTRRALPAWCWVPEGFLSLSLCGVWPNVLPCCETWNAAFAAAGKSSVSRTENKTFCQFFAIRFIFSHRWQILIITSDQVKGFFSLEFVFFISSRDVFMSLLMWLDGRAGWQK